MPTMHGSCLNKLENKVVSQFLMTYHQGIFTKLKENTLADKSLSPVAFERTIEQFKQLAQFLRGELTEMTLTDSKTDESILAMPNLIKRLSTSQFSVDKRIHQQLNTRLGELETMVRELEVVLAERDGSAAGVRTLTHSQSATF